LVDNYAKIFDFIAVIWPPNRLQELSVGDRPVRVIHQHLEQIELFGCQPDTGSVARPPPRVEIDVQFTITEPVGNRVVRRACSSDSCANSRKQLLNAEWFR